MALKEQKQTAEALRELFKKMDSQSAQEIRDAYYKAMDGLRALGELLEVADAKQEELAGPLLIEHLLAIEALDVMKQSVLGSVL